jgi:hypothetical protein
MHNPVNVRRSTGSVLRLVGRGGVHGFVSLGDLGAPIKVARNSEAGRAAADCGAAFISGEDEAITIASAKAAQR